MRKLFSLDNFFPWVNFFSRDNFFSWDNFYSLDDFFSQVDFSLRDNYFSLDNLFSRKNFFSRDNKQAVSEWVSDTGTHRSDPRYTYLGPIKTTLYNATHDPDNDEYGQSGSPTDVLNVPNRPSEKVLHAHFENTFENVDIM